jgi:transposase-like protein
VQKLWWVANLGLLVMLMGLVWLYIESISGWATNSQYSSKKRALKARSPKDCEPCWVSHVLGEVYPRSGPLPWQALKSRRGRPKQYDSHGFACMNVACAYYAITDAQIHALRRDGQRNACEKAAQWECGCCLSKHSAWLGTPQYRLKTPSHEVSRALHLSMKGMALADISEVLGYAEPTVQRWLDRGGEHSQRLHHQRFKSLWLRHLQLDELVTKVRHSVKRVWIWTSIDLQTRSLVAWVTGGRTQADAHHLGVKITKAREKWTRGHYGSD